MAGSINKVILVGNVGNDPEVRSFNNGGKVCNFSLATSESWKDKQTGERREKTEWHRVAIFNEGLVGIVERYVKKAQNCISKAPCRPVSGKIATAMTNIPQRSSCRVLMAI